MNFGRPWRPWRHQSVRACLQTVRPAGPRLGVFAHTCVRLTVPTASCPSLPGSSLWPPCHLQKRPPYEEGLLLWLQPSPHMEARLMQQLASCSAPPASYLWSTISCTLLQEPVVPSSTTLHTVWCTCTTRCTYLMHTPSISRFTGHWH